MCTCIYIYLQDASGVLYTGGTVTSPDIHYCGRDSHHGYGHGHVTVTVTVVCVWTGHHTVGRLAVIDLDQ
jgi:hypothetical protein